MAPEVGPVRRAFSMIATGGRLTLAQTYHANGKFTRPDSTFRNFVSRDPNSKFPAEAGRYVLYLTPMCPWVSLGHAVRGMREKANSFRRIAP